MEFRFEKPDLCREFPEVGGGTLDEGRPITLNTANHVVLDAAGLEVAARECGDGANIYIPGNRTIDVGKLRHVDWPEDVTISGDRSLTDEHGALLVAPRGANGPILEANAPGLRVSGLRFAGDVTTHEPNHWTKQTEGIRLNAGRCEVDNCLFAGFGHAGVVVGRDGPAPDSYIHRSEFRDSPMQELGYGVTVWHGEAVVEGSYFDNCRHAISGDGHVDCGIDILSNILGPNTVLQVLDMHRAEESGGVGRQAGRYFNVLKNLMLGATSSVDGEIETGCYVRGTPLEGGMVRQNVFPHAAPPVGRGGRGEAVCVEAEDFESAGITVAQNSYGGDRSRPTVGLS